MINIKENVNEIKLVIKAIQHLSEKSYDAVQTEIYRIASDLRNMIIKGMQQTPKRTDGRKSSVSNATHYPSFPGNFPAIDSGKLVGSLVIERMEEGVKLGSIQNEPPYPMYLDQSENINLKRPWLEEPVTYWITNNSREIIDRIVTALGDEFETR